jgi:hypothetical protein
MNETIMDKISDDYGSQFTGHFSQNSINAHFYVKSGERHELSNVSRKHN